MAQAVGDLRASHFNLGTTSQNKPFVSTMKMNFQKSSGGAQDSLGEKLNVRASHFELGNNKLNYNTTFKTHYPFHQDVENAKLADEKKWDLRTNHFVLGHQDGIKQSVSKATFEAKPIQPNIQNEQDQQKIKMRAHHHDFAESKNKIMRTFYNEQFQQYDPSQIGHQQTQKEIQDRVIGLRQSHIILGKEKLPMQSIQQVDYAKKEGEQQKTFKIPPQQSHFALGNATGDYTTVNQQYLIPQQSEKVEFSAENQQNLRGQDGQQYQTETMGSYKSYIGSQPEYKNMSKQLQSNHFEFGDPKYKIGYQTSYNKNMKPPLSNTNSVSQLRDQKADRGSNFVVGSDSINYQSEFATHFAIPISGQPASLDQRTMKDLRSSHFKFNDVKQNFFKTVSNQSFQVKTAIPNQLDPNQEQNLKSHHFEFGQEKRGMISTMHDIHRPLNGKPNQLNLQQQKDLRTHHFAFS